MNNYLNILIICLLFLFKNGYSQIIEFEDASLKNYLLTKNCVDLDFDGVYESIADLNNDGEIQISEALQIERLQLEDFTSAYPILNLSDITSFQNLKHLNILSLDQIEEITDLNIPSITNLWIGSCEMLKVVDISDLPNVDYLRIEDQIGLEILNLQNGSYPNTLFSLFYTIDTVRACVDSIGDEFDVVAEAMLPGNEPDINCSLSVKEQILNSSTIKIVPNPVESIFKIYPKLAIDAIYIYDVNGKQLRSKFNKLTGEINVSQIQNGLYFVKLALQNQVIYKSFLINNRKSLKP